MSQIKQDKTASSKSPTKIVVRHLPADFTLKKFLQIVSPLPKYNYISFVKGETEDVISNYGRVYINFCCPDDVFAFCKKFDNYTFLGKNGMEYQAVVEYAPYQKIPKQSNRKDAKCGTIESSYYFKKFLDNIRVSKLESRSNKEYDFNLTSSTAIETTTPLLRFLSERTRHSTERSKFTNPRNIITPRNGNTIVFFNSKKDKLGKYKRRTEY